MGHIEVANLTFSLPGGRTLFADLSFRVPSGRHGALIGANGVGKTTILRLLAGEEKAQGGAVVLDGTVAYMRQFVGSFDPDATVLDLLLSVAPVRIREAARALGRSENNLSRSPGSSAQFRYAEDLSRWAEIGGYDAEVMWDKCTTAALGLPFTAASQRRVDTLSGGGTSLRCGRAVVGRARQLPRHRRQGMARAGAERYAQDGPLRVA